MLHYFHFSSGKFFNSIAYLEKKAKILHNIVKEFMEDKCLEKASALAFITILSLIPLAAISFSLFSRFKLSEDEVQKVLLKHILPNSQLVSVIQEYISKFSQATASLSFWGTFFLAIVAISLLNNIETFLNEIWNVTTKRSLLNKFTTFWSAITLAPILIAFSIIYTAKIKTFTSSFMGIPWETGFFKEIAFIVTPFFLRAVLSFLFTGYCPSLTSKPSRP